MSREQNSASKTRVLSVSTIFPSSDRPTEGVFVHQRQKHLPQEFKVDVVRMRPSFPILDRLRPHLAPQSKDFETVDGLGVHDLRFYYTPRFFKSWDGDHLARCLLRWLNARPETYDLLDAHFAFPTGYGVVKVARKLGIPSMMTLRGTMPSYLSDARAAKIREGLLGADHVVAVSQSLADQACELAGQDLLVTVIGNGVDTERFRPNDRVSARAKISGVPGCQDLSEGPVLLTVGGLVPRKGVQRVLEVMPAVLERHPRARYLVVGGGGAEGNFESELRSRRAALGLETAVSFVGPIAPERLADFYCAADLFVLATANEGWANALQEALACGTPVVTTAVGGNSEVVGGQEQGIVVPFGDTPALESAVLAALDLEFDRSVIARWGRRRDWNDVGREVAHVYREILASR
ncbi:MAG: glycosyltransferase [Planctomycetota bacterium]